MLAKVNDNENRDGPQIEDGAYCNWPRRAASSDLNRSRWHVVHGQLEAQRRLTEWRTGLDIVVYSPMVRMMEPVPKKLLSAKQRKSLLKIKRPVLRQLFPGYFFVKFDRRDDRWHEIFRFVGVYGMVCEGDQPVPMSDQWIESLRSKEVDGAVPGRSTLSELAFAVGDRVLVTDGPFEGFSATVQRVPTKPIEELDEDDRVSLLLSLFGRQCALSQPISGVEKL